MGTTVDDADVRGFSEAQGRIFGIPGPDVSAWGVSKKDASGKYRRCEHPAGDGTYAQQWPLSELTAENVRDRWGAGEYRCHWFVYDPENPEIGQRHRGGGSGTPFRLQEQEPVRVAAPPPVAVSTPSDFEKAMQFMALADERSSRQLANILSTSAALAGRNAGLDATTLGLILDRQAAQTAQLLQTMQAQHTESLAAVRAELAAVRAELTTDDDEDGGESTAATVARAAAPLFKPGKPVGESIKAAVLNYASEHPDKLIDALKTVPQIINALGQLGQQQAQAQQAPPAPPQPRPRAIPANVPPPRPEPSPPAPAPGINEFFSQSPPPTEKAPPVVDAVAAAAE